MLAEPWPSESQQLVMIFRQHSGLICQNSSNPPEFLATFGVCKPKSYRQRWISAPTCEKPSFRKIGLIARRSDVFGYHRFSSPLPRHSQSSPLFVTVSQAAAATASPISFVDALPPRSPVRCFASAITSSIAASMNFAACVAFGSLRFLPSHSIIILPDRIMA